MTVVELRHGRQRSQAGLARRIKDLEGDAGGTDRRGRFTFGVLPLARTRKETEGGNAKQTEDDSE